MSYSQNEEEAAILKACASIHPRRFLDIGAFHPENLSNTRALFGMGWKGVMIEPSPFAMTNLLRAYGTHEDITLIQAAVAVEGGLKSLYVSEGPVSTSVEGVKTTWENQYVGSMYVPHLTLEELFVQFDGGFGFINIDTEGTSAELAMHLLTLTKDTPCLCVEWDGDPRGLMSRMTAADYVLRYSSAENGVWSK